MVYRCSIVLHNLLRDSRTVDSPILGISSIASADASYTSICKAAVTFSQEENINYSHYSSFEQSN